MKPFIKWVGGKTKALNHIMDVIPKVGWFDYYEPFLGGGSVFLNLSDKGLIKGNSFISDMNKDLIDTYKQVKENPNILCDILDGLKKTHSSEQYYKIRDLFNNVSISLLDKAAYFIYLNKTGFNGLYRVNSSGKYNVPIGSYIEPKIFNKDDMNRVSELLYGTTIECCSFFDMTQTITTKVYYPPLFYFDPPYDPQPDESSFTKYTVDGFGLNDQILLASEVKRLSDLGCMVIVSNRDTKTVRELYSGFNIKNYETTRSINSDGSGRNGAVDVLISNTRGML